MKVEWLTPPQQDGEVQAQRVRQAVNEGVDGILISCSDAGKVTGAINDAVDRGVPVMTFDSDAPQSKRFAFYGVDDEKTGQQTMAELAKVMNGKGNVAILAGNQNAPNLQRRVQGAKDEAAKYPGIKIVGVFNHIETPQDASAEVVRVEQRVSRDHGLGDHRRLAALDAVAAHRHQPGEDEGRVGRRAPVAARVRREGHRARCCSRSRSTSGATSASRRSFEKVHDNKQPANPIMPMELVRVTKDEPRRLGAAAEGVGLHRRGSEVPRAAVGHEAVTEPAVRFDRVSKRFPGVQALTDVSFEIAAGSCHALCGENGAGKSTLGKIVAGHPPPDGGRLFVDGREVHFGGPRDALAAGVGMVHQELAFCDNLSVAENLCLVGAAVARGHRRSRRDAPARATRCSPRRARELDVERPFGELAIGQRQMVQIAAAVGGGARIIVFDEPTSSLSQAEAERLFELIERLKARGVTCIYVSHRMPEIFRLCDAVTRAARRTPRRDAADGGARRGAISCR